MNLTITYNDINELLKKAVETGITDLGELLKNNDDLVFTAVKCRSAVGASLKFSEIGLSVRAVNCIQNYTSMQASRGYFTHLSAKTTDDIEYYVKTMTVANVYDNIKSLMEIPGCGKETATELCEKFESFGFEVDNWRNELNHWHK